MSQGSTQLFHSI